LSEYYYAYLKKNLTDYQTALKTAYDAASGPTLKNIAQEYSISTQTILKTQQLASN
jgi:LysM repeat protein